MKSSWYQLTLDYWQNLRLKNTLLATWIALAAAIVLYYLLVVMTSDYAITSIKKNNRTDTKNIEWMATVGQELVKLRNVSQHKKSKTNETAFTLVNQAIDKQGWNNLVSDMHQVSENSVQVSFKIIGFVSATLILQRNV